MEIKFPPEVARLVAKSSKKDATPVVGQLDRLLSATGAKNESALASWLGISSQSVYKAKSKEKIPANWFVEVATRMGVSSDWLIFGKSPIERDKRPGEGIFSPTPENCGSVGPVALESELCKERDINRDLVAENRQLWKENGELKVKIGELNVQNVKLEGERDTARQQAKEYYERLKIRDAPDDKAPESTRKIA